MSKRISVINFKGGVGKTTLAFHLATGLVRYHEARVLVVDVDHQSSLSILCMGPDQWEEAVQAERTVDRIFQHMTVNGATLPGSEIIWSDPIRDSLYPGLDLVPATLHLDDTEIELASSSSGNAIKSEWNKRTLLCRWLESIHSDEYDYVIFDCPPATKLVSQNAIAASHGYIVPVVPEAVMERGAPHLVQLVRHGIDSKLQALARFGDPYSTYVPDTRLVGIVVTRIQTARGESGYTLDHTAHLAALERQWGEGLVTPYIEQGIGISESLTAGVPVFDRGYTQNVGLRGFPASYRVLAAGLHAAESLGFGNALCGMHRIMDRGLGKRRCNAPKAGRVLR
jgi:chromosome partitioning protein